MPKPSPQTVGVLAIDEFEVAAAEDLDCSIAISEVMAKTTNCFTARVGVILSLANACDALETMSAGFVIPQLKQDEFSDLEGIAASVFLGMLFGGVASGYFTVRFGKKRVLKYSLRLESLAGICGASAQTGTVFGLCRFASGFGIGAAVPPLFNLAEELIEPSSRRRHWLNLIASAFLLGTVIDAVLAWVLLGLFQCHWRAFYLSTSLFPICVAQLVASWVPESPSFLIANGSRSALQMELSKLEYHNWEPLPDLAFRLAHADHLASLSVAHCPTKSASLSLLLGPWRGSLAQLSFICAATAFAWYGLATWLLLIFSDAGIQNEYLAAIAFAISAIPGVLCSQVLITRVPPRKVMGTALSLTALLCVVVSITFSPKGDSAGKWLPPVAAASVVCFFNSTSTVVFNTIVIVWAAPFPLELQALAVAFQSSWMRLGAFVAELVDGSLVQVHATSQVFWINAAMLLLAACSSFALEPMKDELQQDKPKTMESQVDFAE